MTLCCAGGGEEGSLRRVPPLPFPSLTILDFALYEKPVFLHVGAMVFIPLGSEAPWRSPRAARAWVPGGLSSGGCRKAHFRVEVWGFI